MKKKSANKRLFLIAGYSAQKIVDTGLIYMLQAMSEHGDTVLVMDSDVPQSELNKISKYVLHASAKKHGEYDFGSYKRAYTYARDTGILSNYDFVYLINDSVYGPLYPIDSYLKKMESFNTDAFGLVWHPHKTEPHIQSWFIGMRQSVFLSEQFDKFITSVTHQHDKGMVTYLYERGFTRLLEANKFQHRCLFNAPGRSIYNKIKKFYRMGLPFMKKCAFTRHSGRLGAQILYVLNHISKPASDSILSAARATYGDKYIFWLLTGNPFKIIWRSTIYFIHKICTEKL